MTEHSDSGTAMVPDSAEQAAADGDARIGSGASGSVWTTALVAGGVSMLVALATVGALIAAGVGKSKVATLDISGIVEIEQMRMTALMMRKETTEDERMRAMSRAKSFGENISNAIAELQASCKCVIVTRNAVIGKADLDLTDAAKAKLGMAGIDLDQARASAEQAIDRRIPSTDELSRKAQEMVKR